MPPARPKLVKDTGVVFKSFDQYVAEANTGKPPFVLPISADEELTVVCPTSDDIIAMADAQLRQDLPALAVAVFKDDATRILALAGPQPFPVMTTLVQDIMSYYGMATLQLPES